ncbi:MAG TPA: type II toxin-antitoxin system RelE/ParE family toxin [Stellaceae bacterium]|nr:type II toxin-antitoxin system RelE/ParE family toxin [Stellaceae bacterium]
MKKFKVTFRPLAENDLFRLYEYISEQSGHERAAGYIDRIEATCRDLETFPNRGTRRNDIRPDLRTMGFERRVTIVFEVKKTEVVIVRILYGGQDDRVIGDTTQE